MVAENSELKGSGWGGDSHVTQGPGNPNAAFTLTLETPRRTPRWRCCPSSWSCGRCPHHRPPQNRPGSWGSSGCSWAEVRSCGPSPGPPEEHGSSREGRHTTPRTCCRGLGQQDTVRIHGSDGEPSRIFHGTDSCSPPPYLLRFHVSFISVFTLNFLHSHCFISPYRISTSFLE